VAEALLRQGAQLTIVDNLESFYAEGRKRANLRENKKTGACDFLETDICGAEALDAGVRPSIEQPALYETENVSPTLQTRRV
jgi:nucleoside-diphosphate-sugar epimerase